MSQACAGSELRLNASDRLSLSEMVLHDLRQRIWQSRLYVLEMASGCGAETSSTFKTGNAFLSGDTEALTTGFEIADGQEHDGLVYIEVSISSISSCFLVPAGDYGYCNSFFQTLLNDSHVC